MMAEKIIRFPRVSRWRLPLPYTMLQRYLSQGAEANLARKALRPPQPNRIPWEVI